MAPTDGPIGDSALIVDDGETRLLNMNDSRPPDPDHLLALGPIDILFLQFSGRHLVPHGVRPAAAREGSRWRTRSASPSWPGRIATSS